MGYMIGMPCLKLNNVGRKSASCGSFAAVAAEALEERQGRDPDIDRGLTPDNIYAGYRTAAELLEYSQGHVAELSEKQRAEGKRGIRGDAVVMCATIIKPPAAFMATLAREEQIRFLQDAKEKLEEVVGKENVKSTVMHFDEQGGHLHTFWEPMTDDGRLCAKEKMNLKFFKALNTQMPAHLRSRGWDIDDCNAYDEAKEALKSEQEKYQERRERGRSSVVYKAQAEAEKNRLCTEIDGLEDKVAGLKAQAREAIVAAETAKAVRKKAEEDVQAAEKRLGELVEPIHTLEEYNLTADSADATVTAIEASRTAVDRLFELPRLASWFNRGKASDAVHEVASGLYTIIDVAKRLVKRLIGYEDLVKMPKTDRRSMGLDERIRKADAFVSKASQTGRDNRDRE